MFWFFSNSVPSLFYVRPSRCGNLSKRKHIQSSIFHHLVRAWFCFLRIPPLLKSPEGNPRGGGGSKYTALEKFAIFDRRLSRKRYEICPWLLRITNRKSPPLLHHDRSIATEPIDPRRFQSFWVIFRGRSPGALYSRRSRVRTVWPRMSKVGMMTHVDMSRGPKKWTVGARPFWKDP